MSPENPPAARSTRPVVLLWVFAVACFTVPGLFWWSTTYGRRLDDSQLAEFLTPAGKPDEVRHALNEIAERYEHAPVGMDRWVPRVIEVSRSSDISLRIAAAWAMQHDASRPEYRQRLREMLADPAPLARFNAATALTRAGDASVRPVLLEMLEAHTLTAPTAGVVERVLSRGSPARPGAPAARIEPGDGEPVDLATPIEGKVLSVAAEVGAKVAAGDVILVITPSEEQVLNAVTGLMLVGRDDDVPALRRVADQRSGHAEGTRSQAEAAIAAIRRRSGG